MNRIKQLRKEHKLSQIQLAEMLNVHQTAISQWETDRTKPDIEVAKRMADIFGTTTDHIYGRDEENKAQASGSDCVFPKDLVGNSFSGVTIEDIEKFLPSYIDQKVYDILSNYEKSTKFNDMLELKHKQNITPERQLTFEGFMKRAKDAESGLENEVLISYDVIGNVAAGYNGVAIEEYTGDTCEIPASFIKGHSKEDFFVLRVKGNSMYPKIIDGDLVLVKRCESVDSGDTAIVLYESEEATVKKVRFVSGEDWMELVPVNPEYEVKRIEGSKLQYCRILGKVCKLIRDI